MCCDFRKKKPGSSQPTTAAGPLGCHLTYYAKLRPLAVCIHKEGSNLCNVYGSQTAKEGFKSNQNKSKRNFVVCEIANDVYMSIYPVN